VSVGLSNRSVVKNPVDGLCEAAEKLLEFDV
jgi:hypothetical protein